MANPAVYGKRYYGSETSALRSTGQFHMPAKFTRVYRNRNGDADFFQGTVSVHPRGNRYITLLDPYFVENASYTDRKRLGENNHEYCSRIKIYPQHTIYLPARFRKDLQLDDRVAITSIVSDATHLELWRPEDLDSLRKEKPMDWKLFARISNERILEMINEGGMRGR